MYSRAIAGAALTVSLSLATASPGFANHGPAMPTDVAAQALSAHVQQPAHAAADMRLTVDPESGPVGTRVTIRGENYPPNEDRQVAWVCDWNPAHPDQRVFTTVNTGNGSWTIKANIPDNCGTDGVIAIYPYGNSPFVNFRISDTVTPPKPTPPQAPDVPDSGVPSWFLEIFASQRTTDCVGNLLFGSAKSTWDVAVVLHDSGYSPAVILQKLVEQFGKKATVKFLGAVGKVVTSCLSG